MKSVRISTSRAVLATLVPVLLGIGACASSAPVQLHALSASAPPRTPGAAVVPSPARGITIEPVSVPRYADVPQLVFTAADGVSHVSEDHRWRAPLSDEIAGALSQRLQARHGIVDVGRIAVPENMPVLRLRVDVQRFEALPGSGEVLVSAVWSLRANESRHAALQCVAHVQRPVHAATAEALVQAYRMALTALGDQIGQAVQELGSKSATPAICPPAG